MQQIWWRGTQFLIASISHGLDTTLHATPDTALALHALHAAGRTMQAVIATALLSSVGLPLALAAVALLHVAGRRRLRRERARRHALQRRLDEVSDNLPVVVFQAWREQRGGIELELIAGDAPQLFSASPRELRSDPGRVIAAVAVPDRRRVWAEIARASRRRQRISLHFTAQGVRGPRQVTMHAWPTATSGKGQHWTGYWMDVSDACARDEAIAAAHAQAEADAAGRGRLLATLGSGIGRPMRTLLQRLTTLREGPLDAPQRAALDALEDAAAMLARILDDVLALSGTDDAELGLDATPVDLRAVLGSVEQLLLPVACAKGLQLRQQADARTARWLLADATRLRQILFNIVGNAIKFTDRGDVAIAVQVLEDAHDMQHLRIEVSDTGVGIPLERQHAVFEPFTQVDVSTPRRHGGTGLGLGICQRLVRRMGGHMALRSAPGCGTVVSIELALQRVIGPVQAAPAHTVALPAATSTQSAAARVLVAEDHPTQQLLMQWWLRGMGLEVDVAGDGGLALAAWREGNHALLFTDERMPGLDGVELVARIRAEERWQGRPAIPVIGMSADPDGMQGADVQHVLAKPISRRTLHDAIEHVLPGLLPGQPVPAAASAAPGDDTPSLATLAARFGSEETARVLVRSLRQSLEEDLQALQLDRTGADAGGVDPHVLSQRLHRMAGGIGSIGLHALAMQVRELSEAEEPIDDARRRDLHVRLQGFLQHLRGLQAG